MGTSAEKMAYLAGTKSAIASAISDKGVEVLDTDTFRSYADKISAIETGGSGDEPTYLVQFIGYRGEILQSGRYASGDTVNVPDSPSQDGLVFDGWSSPVAITDGAVTVGNSDLTIGAMFDTESGATEIDITLTTVTGLTATIALFGNVTSIDWGDGETSTELGDHTYDDYGDYTIKVYASGVMSDGTASSGMLGAVGSSALNFYCQEVRFGGVTTIGGYALNYSNLVTVTMPASVTAIGTYAFANCYRLANLSIPSGITTIEAYTFYFGCGLTTINIPLGVTAIGDQAFRYCYGLASVTIPDGVTAIGNYGFGQCYTLTDIAIPDSLTTIGGYAFQACYRLASVDIPEGVTAIGTYAFYQCYALADITIPDSVTTIENQMCNSCYGFTSVTIPDGVTTIGTYAFQSCLGITSLTLPSSVASIGNYAFSYCRNLISCDFTAYTSADTVPTLGNANAFTTINGICKLYFRDQDTLDNFAGATNWASYANYMCVKDEIN